MKIEDKIQALEEKLKQAKALKQKKEARERVAAEKTKRMLDTRRKILIGACMLTETESDPDAKGRLDTVLDRRLTRPDDRALFNLPAQP